MTDKKSFGNRYRLLNRVDFYYPITIILNFFYSFEIRRLKEYNKINADYFGISEITLKYTN